MDKVLRTQCRCWPPETRLGVAVPCVSGLAYMPGTDDSTPWPLHGLSSRPLLARMNDENHQVQRWITTLLPRTTSRHVCVGHA